MPSFPLPYWLVASLFAKTSSSPWPLSSFEIKCCEVAIPGRPEDGNPTVKCVAFYVLPQDWRPQNEKCTGIYVAFYVSDQKPIWEVAGAVVEGRCKACVVVSTYETCVVVSTYETTCPVMRTVAF